MAAAYSRARNWKRTDLLLQVDMRDRVSWSSSSCNGNAISTIHVPLDAEETSQPKLAAHAIRANINAFSEDEVSRRFAWIQKRMDSHTYIMSHLASDLHAGSLIVSSWRFDMSPRLGEGGTAPICYEHSFAAPSSVILSYDDDGSVRVCTGGNASFLHTFRQSLVDVIRSLAK